MSNISDINIKYLEKKDACRDGIDWFLEKNVTGFDEIYTFAKEDDKLDYINWYITKKMTKRERIQYAIFAAESVLHIWESYDATDKRPQQAIKAARAYLINQDAAAAYAAYAAYSAAAAAAACAADAADAYADAAAAAAAYSAAYAAYSAAYAAAAYAADAADAADAAKNGKSHLTAIIDFGISLLNTKTVD